MLDKFPPMTLASLNVNAMKMSGAAGRTLDQTISIMGSAGSLIKIEFHPKIWLSQLNLPKSVELVVHNALIPTKTLQNSE